MKKGFLGLLAGLCLFLSTTVVTANPVALSTFTAQDGVTVSESDGVVEFSEYYETHIIYFWNESFQVDEWAKELSFNYFFNRKEHENTAIKEDYFLFEIFLGENLIYDKFLPELPEGDPGFFKYDLTLLRGKTVSLEWSLGSDLDDTLYESTAKLYKIDLATEKIPVPEPSTLVCLWAGLLGVLGLHKRRGSRSGMKS